MLSLMAGLVLVGAQEADPAEQLAKLCKKAPDVGSFAFEMKIEDEGGFGGGRGSDAPVVGRFKKGLPVQLKRGEMEVYREDDQLIYQSAKDQWEVFDMEGAFGGGGDRELMFELFTMQAMPLPHKVLATLDQKVTEVVSAKKDGKTVFSGKLNEKGAEEYSGAARMREMGSRFGAGEMELKVAGTFQLTVNADGVFEQLILDTSLSGAFGDREFDRGSKKTVALTAVGETELKVPDKVLACLEI